MGPRSEGKPQGGPLSPMLPNFLLDEPNKEIDHRGHIFSHYSEYKPDCGWNGLLANWHTE